MSPLADRATAIYMPVMVIYCGDEMVKMTGEEFSAGCRRVANGHLQFPDASLPRMRVTGLLDRRGYFHKVIPLNKRRAFLSWFSRVWDFTKMVCAIETFEPMRVSDLLKEAKNWKNSSGQKVRRFLEKQKPDASFDEAMFRRAWEATYIALPESEWNRMFVLRE